MHDEVIILTKAKLSDLAKLVYDLRQHLNLSQEKFAARLGVSFKTVNRWEKGHSLPSSMALKLIEDLLKSIGEPGKALIEQYFPDKKSDV